MQQCYLDNAATIFKKYNGTYLAVDDKPLTLEGSWDYTRTVLIQFKSKSDFEAWYNSDEYQKILTFRLKAAHCDSILVRGTNEL